MGLSTDLKKPVSEKMFILDISSTFTQGTWVAYEAGIWFYTLTPASPEVSDTGSVTPWFYTGMSDKTIVVLSTRVDGIFYTESSSLSNLRITNESFYWDNDMQTLYFHFDNNNPYYTFLNITLGASTGYSNKAFYDDNDTYYSPLIELVPNISMNKDPLFFGIFSYDGGGVTISNKEGQFDDTTLFGETIVGKFGFRDLLISEWSTTFNMYAEDSSFNYDVAIFNIQDKRKSLSLRIPVNIFDIDTYPYISEDMENEPIPIAWGTVRDVPVAVINHSEVAPSAWVIKLMDTTNHYMEGLQIPVVYVEGIAVTISNFSASAGTCEIAPGDYDPESGYIVTADYIGNVTGGNVPIENSLNVIEDILVEYMSIPYTVDTYNTVEWAAEKLNTYDIGLAVFGNTQINDVIELICASNSGIFLIQNDGRYTFRTYDEDRVPTLTIPYDELLGKGADIINVDYPSEEYLTDNVVKYNKGWNGNRYRSVRNISYKDEVFAEKGQYNSRTFETVLVNKADAETIAENIMLRSKNIIPTFRVTVMQQAMEIEVMQFVQLQTDSPRRELFGEVIAEVVGFDKDPLTGEVQLTLKFVKYA